MRRAAVTADRYRVGTVVCVQDPDMKQAWCLAASSTDATAKQLTGLYGRRWEIECSFRDSKDLRFGMGLGTIHVKSPERRDRLWLINAFAVVLLTLLGAAGRLGIQGVGVGISELSAAFSLAVEMGARLEDVAGTVFAHPTLGEGMLEAALKTLGQPIHI